MPANRGAGDSYEPDNQPLWAQIRLDAEGHLFGPVLQRKPPQTRTSTRASQHRHRITQQSAVALSELGHAAEGGAAAMIVLTDTVNTWGYSATVHYSHAPHTVIAQSTLALHMEFNANIGPNPTFRSYALIRTAIVGGATVTVNGPCLVATSVTEVHVELISDNGAAVGVVNQFDTTGASAGPPKEPSSVRMVSFHRPSNGTTAYAHTAKVYAGGRDITEQEAIDTAIAGLRALGLDPADLVMKVTTDAARASRPQRLDLETTELVDEVTDPRIG
jgi:hypothetical protein